MLLRTGGVARRVLWILALALLLVIPARVFAQERAPSRLIPEPLCAHQPVLERGADGVIRHEMDFLDARGIRQRDRQQHV